MKTNMRRWIGAALIGGSLLSQWLVTVVDFFPMTLVKSETHSSGSMTAIFSVYSVEVPVWLSVIMLAGIIIGLALLIWPNHEKPNA